MIWMLSKAGLVSGLRTIPVEKIIGARLAEQERLLRK